MDLNYYRKFTKSNENISNIEVSQLSESYSNQYNHAISPFDIIINSDRADIIYKDSTMYKCVVDYNKMYGKGDFTTSNDPWREIWTKYSDEFKIGDLIEFENKVSKDKVKAIIMRLKETREGYMTGFMQECNFELEWVDKATGANVSTCVILESKNPYSPGIDESPKITIGDNQRSIITSDTEYTRRWQRDDVFTIGGLMYKISSINRESSLGLCSMIVTEYQAYPVEEDTYTIEAGVEVIDIVNGNDYQLTPTVKKNDNVISSDIGYESSEESIVTVDEDGLIDSVSTGVATITAYLKGNSAVFDTVTVNVVLSPSIVTEYRFDDSSKSRISVYDNSVYNFNEYQNGVVIPNSFTYNLDYNGHSNSIASLEVIDGNSVKINANTSDIYGTIYLVASEGVTERGRFEIKIVSMWG